MSQEEERELEQKLTEVTARRIGLDHELAEAKAKVDELEKEQSEALAEEWTLKAKLGAVEDYIKENRPEA